MNRNLIFSFLIIISTNLFADIKTTINLAGKERMLTQKMSKEALLITRGIDVASNQNRLLRSVELFDKILNGLYYGNRDLSLSKTDDREILRELDRVKRAWIPFKKNILLIANGKKDKKILEFIDKKNVELLNLIDIVVELYRDRSNIEPQLAQTINLAGKERMLSQKMAKELLLIANNLKSDRNIKSLKSGGELFQKTLNRLVNSKDTLKDRELLNKIKHIQNIWIDYQNRLLNTDFTPKSRKETKKRQEEVIEELTKELLFIANKIDDKIYKKQLRETGKKFDLILNGLIDGNSSLGLMRATNPKIVKELHSAKEIWDRYRPIIYEGNISEKALNMSIKLNNSLLKRMEKVVQFYSNIK
jgi:hypothetical protein